MGYQDKDKGHVLEVDTDGILIDKKVDINKVNSFIKREKVAIENGIK